MYDRAPVIGRPHRVGLLLVPGVLAGHVQEDLVDPIQELRVAGRDHGLDPRLAAGLGEDAHDEPPAGEVAEAAIPGRLELPRDHRDDSLQLPELWTFQELTVLRQELERLLDPGIGQAVDQQGGVGKLQR